MIRVAVTNRNTTASMSEIIARAGIRISRIGGRAMPTRGHLVA